MPKPEFEDDPQGLIEAITIVRDFLESTPEEQAEIWLAPSDTKLGLAEAIRKLRTETRDREWLYEAIKLRIEIALGHWERIIDKAEACGWQGRFANFTYWLGTTHREELTIERDTGGMTMFWMNEFMNHGSLDKDYKEVLGRWIRILLRLPVGIDLPKPEDDEEESHAPHPDRWKRVATEFILAFNNCKRKNNPNHRILACRSMLKHFGLNPEWAYGIPQ